MHCGLNVITIILVIISIIITIITFGCKKGRIWNFVGYHEELFSWLFAIPLTLALVSTVTCFTFLIISHDSELEKIKDAKEKKYYETLIEKNAVIDLSIIDTLQHYNAKIEKTKEFRDSFWVGSYFSDFPDYELYDIDAAIKAYANYSQEKGGE